MTFFIWHIFCSLENIITNTVTAITSFNLIKFDVTCRIFLCIFMVLLLCFCIINFMLGIQLYDILQLFRLIILFSLLLSLKCFSINFMNNLPILVLTGWYNGGFKNIIFLLRFRVFLHCEFLFSMYFRFCLKLDFVKACWYIVMIHKILSRF